MRNVMINPKLFSAWILTMIQMTLKEAAAILGQSNPSSPATYFTGVSIDTRTIKSGNLFVAIPGSRTNGHAFLHDAEQKGASAGLVQEINHSALPQLKVDNTVMALGRLAAFWRDQFTIPFIAITGSNGKTTLKSMIASILSCASNDEELVLSPQGTFNNHIGLPLTLARLNPAHRYAVIEMGMNHFGEIAYLTQLTKPNIAVITNAAECHLEGVGDLAGVARAKAEIFCGLQSNGIAILNHDDHFFNYWREMSRQHDFISFGFHSNATIRATIHTVGQGTHLTLHTPKGNIPIHLPIMGKHNVMNALAATATSIALDISPDAIKKGLEHLSAVPGRLQLHKLVNGVNIIDDTYNANPLSLEAAIETLATFSGKKILVLGDMKELGNDTQVFHFRAGEKIRLAGIDYLFTLGEFSATTATAFGEGAYHFNEQNKLLNALKPFLHTQATILIKGSRSMHMEKIVAGLLGSVKPTPQ